VPKGQRLRHYHTHAISNRNAVYVVQKSLHLLGHEGHSNKSRAVDRPVVILPQTDGWTDEITKYNVSAAFGWGTKTNNIYNVRAIRWRKNFAVKLSRFDTVPDRDGQTDGNTFHKIKH